MMISAAFHQHKERQTGSIWYENTELVFGKKKYFFKYAVLKGVSSLDVTQSTIKSTSTEAVDVVKH